MLYGSSNSAHTEVCTEDGSGCAISPFALPVPPLALLLTPAVGLLAFLLALPVGLLAFLLALPLLAFRPLLI
jgi:hypothetical protein